MTQLYKFLTLNNKTPFRHTTPELGKWLPPVEVGPMCQSGYHACNLAQLKDWFRLGNLYEVEVRGDAAIGEQKSAHAEMKIGRLVGTVTPEIAVQLAIEAAESVLHIFEERFPNDDRPRKAIEAAKQGNGDSAADARAAAAYAAATAVRAARAARFVGADTYVVGSGAARVAAHAATYAARARAAEAAYVAACAADAADAADAAVAARVAYAAAAADAADAAVAVRVAYAAAARIAVFTFADAVEAAEAVAAAADAAIRAAGRAARTAAIVAADFDTAIHVDARAVAAADARIAAYAADARAASVAISTRFGTRLLELLGEQNGN